MVIGIINRAVMSQIVLIIAARMDVLKIVLEQDFALTGELLERTAFLRLIWMVSPDRLRCHHKLAVIAYVLWLC